MSLSIFLAIYFIFLIIYGALMSFAVYKVFLFAKNKDLKGHSRRITLVFTIIVLSIISISFIIIPRYKWDDSTSYYCKKLFPQSCSCESNDDAKKICEEEKAKEKIKSLIKEENSMVKLF